MALMYFKLKYNGHIRLVDFKGLPNWSELFTKLQTLYDLPVDKLGIYYIDKDDDEITISSNEELQCFYRSAASDHTYQTFKVNVVDLSIPSDAENLPQKGVEVLRSVFHVPDSQFLMVSPSPSPRARYYRNMAGQDSHIRFSNASTRCCNVPFRAPSRVGKDPTEPSRI